MINPQLIAPKSIAVIGASNNLRKAGGKMLHNIIEGGFEGKLYAVNRTEGIVQGQKTCRQMEQLPKVELAILAIPAKHCPAAIEILASTKGTKAFIVISAGFSELNEQGEQLESKMIEIVHQHDACLAGPNCIGIINRHYHGVFTDPIPTLDPNGCDFISSSGATAVFVMEAGMLNGLRFSSVYSVGNGNDISVEDYLQYLDENFNPDTSSRIKILYMEQIKSPQKLLKHARSLMDKGCRIAAIKAGATTQGSRAASSHTGAMANSDMATRALFRKAGIVYCSSREELISVASVFSYKKLSGKNIAIITHAGGSAVMLTDELSKGGLNVPIIEGEVADELLSYLNPGSSVSNPIDFLATGTADQLGIIIDFCEYKMDHIDAMIVVFGSPGLFDVENAYRVLNVKMEICQKPIYPVLPSLVNAAKEIQYFLSKGHANFPDEVLLGRALAATYYIKRPPTKSGLTLPLKADKIRALLPLSSTEEYLDISAKNQLADYLHIPRVPEKIVTNKKEVVKAIETLGFPLTMKVVGPLHKTDVGGVALNITSTHVANAYFKQFMAIPNATGVLLQKHLEGIELFVGVTYEEGIGHLLMMGMGGIFVEVLKDIKVCLCPCEKEEVAYLLQQLKAFPILQGFRGKPGINIEAFVDIIVSISQLIQVLPEIVELDLNPLIGTEQSIVAVDMRVKVSTKHLLHEEE